MFDAMKLVTPLDDARLAEGPGAVASLSMAPAPHHFVLRGNERVATCAATVILPPAPCRAACAKDRVLLWLGPDEWLVVSDSDVSGAIDVALSGQAYSSVDVSHRDVTLTVTGAAARDLLNAGCPLDLDDAAFEVGMCTRTLLGKVQIVLWRTGTDAYLVICWRSFACYVWDFLVEARARL